MASLPDGLLSLYYRLNPARTAKEEDARALRRQKRAGKRALRAALESASPPAVLTDAKVKQLWNEMNVDGDDILDSHKTVAFITRSGLARPVLARIWYVH